MELTFDEKFLIDNEQRIPAIQSIRARTGLGLAEALNATKAYRPMANDPIATSPATPTYGPRTFTRLDRTALIWLRHRAEDHAEDLVGDVARHAVDLLTRLLDQDAAARDLAALDVQGTK